MVGVQRGLLIMMAAGAIALGPSSHKVSDNDDGAPVKNGAGPARVAYSASDREFYLSPDQISYVRPGLKVIINSVTDVGSGKKPTVDLTMTDDFGNPLDRLGGTTPGAVSLRFFVATWDATAYTYRNLILNPSGSGKGQPYRDTGGTWTPVGEGRYTYKFALALENFDETLPATLFVGGNRNVVDYIGKTYYVTAFKDGLPPDLATVATTWGATTTAMCNACHDPLALHGGNYREVKACAMCHNPLNMVGEIPATGTEPAEGLAQYNGRYFFHQIHNENQQEIGPITYPQLVQRCVTCHDPKAPNGDTWKTMPSRVACGSCHSQGGTTQGSVNFDTGEGHGPDNLKQPDDTQCANSGCHVATQSAEWDLSVPGSHVLPSDSKQLKGLKVTLLDATNVAPGQKPTVTFKITQNDGSVLAPNTAGLTLSLLFGGNTKDYYQQPVSESATGATFDESTGIATFTFKNNAIPADAKGTWAITAQGRRTVNLVKAVGGDPISYREGAVDGASFPSNDPRNDPRFNGNPILYRSVDGSDEVDRRVVVDLVKCDACHYRLATTFSHGGQRIAIQYCVMCHNPNANDLRVRPDTEPQPAESISFQRMIHRIHTGEELTQEYTVYGNFTPPAPPNPSNFNEVTYPGDRRNCVKCHSSMATAGLPTAPGTLNVVTDRDYFSPRGPATAACTGCHDDSNTAAHAFIYTTQFPGSSAPAESCGTCHNANGEWSPTKVHAR